ncbi:MAG: YicC/YloC family endoribonuclease [Acidobacteriaceae bacterium]|jgi:uncharacterized protein (TIGR00255 family)
MPEPLTHAVSRADLKPIYSMTGYATAQGTTEDGLAFTLTMKSVNHRFLDLNLRLPGDCDALEVALRRLIKERVRRGHVDVTLHVDRRARETTQTVQLNRELLAAHMQVFHEAAKLHHFNVEPDLNQMLQMPGVLSTDAAAAASDATRGPALEAAVMAIAPTLLEQLNQVRGVEGAALAGELRAAVLRLRALAEEAAALRTGAREAHFERLRTRIGELLKADADAAAQVEGPAFDYRMLAEAALLVERSDIEEELVRLRAHIESFLEMLDAGGELGKRLDFLLQELNREGNTMLSKTTGGDPGIGLRLTSLGLEMKTEIERAREQVQNLE